MTLLKIFGVRYTVSVIFNEVQVYSVSECSVGSRIGGGIERTTCEFGQLLLKVLKETQKERKSQKGRNNEIQKDICRKEDFSPRYTEDVV